MVMGALPGCTGLLSQYLGGPVKFKICLGNLVRPSVKEKSLQKVGGVAQRKGLALCTGHWFRPQYWECT